MSLFVLCLTTSVAHVPGIMLRFSPFAALANGRQRRILALSYAAALMLSAVFYALAYRYGFLSITLFKRTRFAVGILLMGVNMLVIRKRAREHLFACGLASLIILFLFMIVTYIGARFQEGDLAANISICATLYCALFFALYIPLKRIMLHTIAPFLAIDSGDYWRSIWFVPIAMAIACIMAVPGDEFVSQPTQLVSRLAQCAAVVFICRSVAMDYRRMQDKQEIARQLSTQKAYYAALSEKVIEARKSRHDFKHHLAAISRFIELDDKDGLRAYTGELIKRQDAQIAIPFTGNAAADGVLYRYALLARERGIDFTISGAIGDNGVEDADLCALIGNALDNALTAASASAAPRFMAIAIDTERQVRSILIRNSYDGIVVEKDGKLLSRKRCGEEGLGMISMKDICARYNGSLTVRCDGRVFSLLLMLNLRA